MALYDHPLAAEEVPRHFRLAAVKDRLDHGQSPGRAPPHTASD
jgi:hypothetical protein